MRLNRNALIFWAFCALVGYLIGGVQSALTGLTIALAASIVIGILFNRGKTK